jgi:hypothetical protein
VLVESFSKKMLESKIFDTYVAAVFFATLIFFVLNIDNYTPFEMIFWIMVATVGFKGVANIMLSLTIALVDIDNEEVAVSFENESNKLESLVNDLAIQEAAVKTNKNK